MSAGLTGLGDVAVIALGAAKTGTLFCAEKWHGVKKNDKIKVHTAAGGACSSFFTNREMSRYS